MLKLRQQGTALGLHRRDAGFDLVELRPMRGRDGHAIGCDRGFADEARQDGGDLPRREAEGEQPPDTPDERHDIGHEVAIAIVGAGRADQPDRFIMSQRANANTAQRGDLSDLHAQPPNPLLAPAANVRVKPHFLQSLPGVTTRSAVADSRLESDMAVLFELCPKPSTRVGG